jgi:hypothetical protein
MDELGRERERQMMMWVTASARERQSKSRNESCADGGDDDIGYGVTCEVVNEHASRTRVLATVVVAWRSSTAMHLKPEQWNTSAATS